MSQSETNQKEWEDEQNWVPWFGIYSSTMDSRLWVRKRMPAWGWTINFGHSNGKITFWLILGFVSLILLTAVFY
ncbi:DUF5808 domain-containing protein [Arenicella xantha]|uniref:DUF5808 domain-containing protein n=1 Tax=Arenicella xantha TaxID=644221 RepID=A0A395JEQ7_9GAMM|nr:DUF5808 domain-containing protein [Arenicella xantha]RBP47130.1 hypothetical protein DFR28_1092 [Arenicella xantha]